MKLTGIVFLSFLLSAAQALVAYYAIYKNSDTEIVTECQYVWLYEVASGIHGTLQAIFSVYTVVCFLLMSEDRKKRPLQSHLTGMGILVIAGIVILKRISPECTLKYENQYPDLWKCFNITFWYAVTILCLFALVNILWLLYRCFCNQSAEQSAKALNDKLVAENRV
ncbi:MAG: hypothetical protein Hyperionvirus15_58 [Hyperionvirus sp.]|uniref:Uncharacterized protein n=1 Tax=Hyperionvirus sp. TaxID=2487770 RepID=A0A3G5A9U8_9VIRU|nr:MAG: hypothetical protein Hyperionvirus15_58 [Hyperionvirus sp.]